MKTQEGNILLIMWPFK